MEAMTMMMMMDGDEHVDIPEGMDPDDARVAIKLLYGADQTYRSALHDFASYEKQKHEPEESLLSEQNTSRSRIVTRKRLRQNTGNGQQRSGRITNLHVTGIASIFLPSWDLSFEDVVQMDHLVCLKLNGCDSIPSEVFFELPCLEKLSLINCQELKDPENCIANHKQHSGNTHSTIQQLDIRGGGLWGNEFLTALRLLFPYTSSTLKSLRLSHTPYASCYNNSNKYTTVQTSEKMIETILLKQTLFHESMGELLLDALSSLARGMLEESSSSSRSSSNDTKDSSPPSSSLPLEYLGLSFFNSLLEKDVASLLLDVIPEFPHLVTLDLPHHTISSLQIASERISDQQEKYTLLSNNNFIATPPKLTRSSCVLPSSIASVSRLRRLWLKPTVKKRLATTGGVIHPHNNNNSSSSSIITTNNNNNNSNNQTEKDILVSLLTHFPELSRVARSGNYRGHLYSPCPCCQDEQSKSKSKSNQTIEYLLRMNHSGRCLVEGLEEQQKILPPSIWPLVLERAWNTPPPDFCAGEDVSASTTSSNTSVVYRLLREGTILFSPTSSSSSSSSSKLCFSTE